MYVTSVHTSACFFHHSIYDHVASRAQQPVAVISLILFVRERKESYALILIEKGGGGGPWSLLI